MNGALAIALRAAFGTAFGMTLIWISGMWMYVETATWFLYDMPITIIVVTVAALIGEHINKKEKEKSAIDEKSRQQFREESARKLLELTGPPRERKDPPPPHPSYRNPWHTHGKMPGSMGDDPGEGMWGDKRHPDD